MKHKLEVYEKVMESRVIAILRNIPVSKVEHVARSIAESGVKAMEVTMDTPSALQAILAIKAEMGDSIAVGAGTVLDAETGRAALLAGAEFLVAPNMNPNVIRLGNRYGRLVIPGCLTPSEIEEAYETGADIVKVFPAANLGEDYIRSIKGPLNHITVMATGGITVENAESFFAAGADILGVGGSLVDRMAIAHNDYETIANYARQLVSRHV